MAQEPNTAAPVKTLQECKDFICLRQFEASEKICKGFLPTDVYLSWMDEAAEMYANQPKAPVMVVTDEEVHDAADHYVFGSDNKWSNNNDECGDNFGSFKRGAEWMRKQLTGI